MNQQDKIDLSKLVAEKYGINSVKGYGEGERFERLWLADDDARCFRLAVDAGLMIQAQDINMVVVYSGIEYYSEMFKYHSDRYEATRIAILKCLDAMKG